MSFVVPITVAVEGDIDEWVVGRLLTHVEFPVRSVLPTQGKHHILKHLLSYNQGAQYTPWLVLIDLDQDADGAPDFVNAILPGPASGMCFRIAVRAVEAWLLADSNHLAAFLRVPSTKFPVDPDTVPDPKVVIVNLARQSRCKVIRQDMVPEEGSGRQVGRGYTGRIREFLYESDTPWRPDVALQHSDSLRRCVAALETLKEWHPTE